MSIPAGAALAPSIEPDLASFVTAERIRIEFLVKQCAAHHVDEKFGLGKKAMAELGQMGVEVGLASGTYRKVLASGKLPDNRAHFVDLPGHTPEQKPSGPVGKMAPPTRLPPAHVDGRSGAFPGTEGKVNSA